MCLRELGKLDGKDNDALVIQDVKGKASIAKQKDANCLFKAANRKGKPKPPLTNNPNKRRRPRTKRR